MKLKFTDEELQIAKSVDLTQVASHLGYTVKRIGQNHTLKEMDSVRIYNRTNWYRWSSKIGGSQIDFLVVICGMEFKEAILWLLDFAGYKHSEPGNGKSQLTNQVTNLPKAEKLPFLLPAPASDNRMLYAYLNEKRKIGIAVIDYFINRGLIYESYPHHNIVFIGKDAGGVARFAHMRGTNSSFKCDVAGSDKNYGFNIANSESDHLNIFESGIDLMSYADLYEEFWTNKLALGMLGDAPIDTFLIEHPQITSLNFFLDADEPGKKASRRMRKKYDGLGYRVTDSTPEISYKDYKDLNEWLVAIRLGPANLSVLM